MVQYVCCLSRPDSFCAAFECLCQSNCIYTSCCTYNAAPEVNLHVAACSNKYGCCHTRLSVGLVWCHLLLQNSILP